MFHCAPSLPAEARPQDQETLRSLAATYLAYGLPAKALSILNLAIWLDSSDKHTMILLAHAAFHAGDHSKGVAAVERLRTTADPIPVDLLRYYRLWT